VNRNRSLRERSNQTSTQALQNRSTGNANRINHEMQPLRAEPRVVNRGINATHSNRNKTANHAAATRERDSGANPRGAARNRTREPPTQNEPLQT
jgi:hypothetical protein